MVDKGAFGPRIYPHTPLRTCGERKPSLPAPHPGSLWEKERPQGLAGNKAEENVRFEAIGHHRRNVGSSGQPRRFYLGRHPPDPR